MISLYEYGRRKYAQSALFDGLEAGIDEMSDFVSKI
jgi:hypothetical protein